jgi:AraC-like DNA-binding protein
VSITGHTTVSRDWRDIDYIPQYYKFYFIQGGEGWIRIGDKEYYPKPGQLVLMPCGVIQSYSVISENTYTKYWCHFNAKVGDMNLFELLNVPYILDVKDSLYLESLFAALDESFNSNELCSPLEIQVYMLRLLAFFISNCPPDELYLIKRDSMEKLNDVLLYIDSNYRNVISVDELARIAHLHPNYFIRLFRKHIGESPIHYLNKKRIDEAKKLLTCTNLPLKEISEKIGLSDVYYLSRVFKEYTGFSPSTYKQMLK